MPLTTASAYPALMKIIVGRTVNTVCSRSWSPLNSSARDCKRAILVASGSEAGAPQLEQKRTLGGTYAPQEQVIDMGPRSNTIPINAGERRSVLRSSAFSFLSLIGLRAGGDRPAAAS